MVLTDVYMYQHKYAEAAKTAQSIIDSQKYSLLANTDMADNSAYNQLRELDNNSEVIYSYEFDPSIVQATGCRLMLLVVLLLLYLINMQSLNVLMARSSVI